MNSDFRRRCKAIMAKTMRETKERAKQDIKDEKKHTYHHQNKDTRSER